jgi:hypothetical protein
MGFFADAGPVQGIYVNKHVRMRTKRHSPVQLLLLHLDVFPFGRVNPISPNPTQQQMPQDYGFDAQEGVWRTSDMEVEIRSGCGVRMRIVGVDITPGRMVSEEGGVGERVSDVVCRALGTLYSGSKIGPIF